MIAAETPPKPRRCVADLLAQLAGLTREFVETARLRQRDGDELGSLAFFSAAERLVEVVRAEDPLPVPQTGIFPKAVADTLLTVLAGADSKVAPDVSTGRIDGQSALSVFYAVRDVVADTDSALAAQITPRLTAMVSRGPDWR